MHLPFLDPADWATMTRRGRTLLPLAAVALVGAACTQQESVTPATAVTTIPVTTAISTTSTPPATDPPTTEAAPATEATTTSIAPSTTTPPPSGVPTSSSTQYFGGGDPDGWMYLGRWTGNEWASAFTPEGTPRQPAIATDDVSIHEIGLDPIAGTVGSTAEACPDGRTGPVISPNARAPEEPGFGYRSIAFEADWPTQPRPVALVDATIDSYVAAGVAAFDDTDTDASSGSIEQLVVADLDGDGDTESLLAFGGAEFSALLLIDADSGAALTVARDVAAVAAPDTGATTEPPAPGPFERHRTLAVADLNGDGLMEFVAHVWESEGETSVIVYDYDGTEVTAVLTTSC